MKAKTFALFGLTLSLLAAPAIATAQVQDYSVGIEGMF